MRRREPSPVLLTIITLVVLATLLVIGWNILKNLPSRYLGRFPKFVQTLVIPEPESAVLPDVVAPVDASALLGDGATAPEPAPAEELGEADEVAAVDSAETSTEVNPAELPTVVSVVIEAPTDVPQPTPTLLPSVATRTPTPVPTIAPTVDPNAPPDATPIPEAIPLPGYHRIEGISHHQQDWNNCGPATLAMGLSIFGNELTQYDTASFLKPDAEDRNVSPIEMAEYVNQFTPQSAYYRVNGNLDILKRLLAANFPVILEIGLDPPGEVAWLEWYGHYVLATGYDDEKQELWLFDSLIWDVASLANTNSVAGRSMPYSDLEIYWPHFNRSYVVIYDTEREAEMAAILGDDFDTIKMWERALEDNKNELNANDSDAFAWFNMGTAYMSLGRHDEAVVAYDKSRSIGLPWRMLWYQFGPYESYYRTGRYPDVILLANTTLSGRPYFEESFYYRGLAHQAMGDIASARNDLQTAVNFNPNFQAAVNALNSLDG